MPDYKLAVVTFCWNGWRTGYNSSIVNKLYRSVQKNLSVPHSFICLNDFGHVGRRRLECASLPVWEDPVIPDKPMQQDCFRRLKLFSWEARIGLRNHTHILQIDLDALIVGSMDHLITWDDFRILKGLSSTPYNGSLWLHRLGTRTHIWNSFDPATSPWQIREHRTGKKPWRGSDQGWMSIAAPGERTYGKEDGVYQCGRGGLKKLPENACIVFFPGDHKPWQDTPEMRRRAPWALDLYNAI